MRERPSCADRQSHAHTNDAPFLPFASCDLLQQVRTLLAVVAIRAQALFVLGVRTEAGAKKSCWPLSSHYRVRKTNSSHDPSLRQTTLGFGLPSHDLGCTSARVWKVSGCSSVHRFSLTHMHTHTNTHKAHGHATPDEACHTAPTLVNICHRPAITNNGYAPTWSHTHQGPAKLTNGLQDQITRLS